MADKLCASPHVVEAILNHVNGHRARVAGVQRLAKYQAEMRAALERRQIMSQRLRLPKGDYNYWDIDTVFYSADLSSQRIIE